MRYSEAALSAVLATLLRATVDERVPVVLRTRRATQARDLARWLARAHGTTRTVVPSVTRNGEIVVRLPVRMVWPAVPTTAVGGHRPLASRLSVSHLSASRSSSPSAGSP